MNSVLRGVCTPEHVQKGRSRNKHLSNEDMYRECVEEASRERHCLSTHRISSSLPPPPFARLGVLFEKVSISLSVSLNGERNHPLPPSSRLSLFIVPPLSLTERMILSPITTTTRSGFYVVFRPSTP